MVAKDEDIARIINAKAETLSDNLAIADRSAKDDAFAGGKGNNYVDALSDVTVGLDGIITNRHSTDATTGNILHLSPLAEGVTGIHEAFHLFGFGDRYGNMSYEFEVDGKTLRTGRITMEHVGSKGDLMEDGWDFSPIHVDDIAKKALEISSRKGSDKFVLGRMVDKANNHDPSLVPQEWKSGTTIYKNPKYEKPGH